MTSLTLMIFIGWHGVEISGFQAGESIAVFGAGPVGLMAAYSAALRGASNIYVVDRVAERLDAAKNIGAIPIDFTKGDAVDQIISHNGGMVDRSVDAVGYQAVDANGSAEKANIVLENMIRVTRACGGMGIPGLYVPRYVNIYRFPKSNLIIASIVTLVLPMLPPPME
jgi:threonine dehydrogenase-like Zn-dependent dehydrogenase